jgi:hypothetical protein
VPALLALALLLVLVVLVVLVLVFHQSSSLPSSAAPAVE